MKKRHRNLGTYRPSHQGVWYAKKINPMKTESRQHTIPTGTIFVKLTFLACFLLGFVYAFLWLINVAMGHKG